MKQFFLQIFSWWNGQTIGTRVFTLRKGIQVGQDQRGNTYYCERGGRRRWVIYNGEVEPSTIPPEWHGWLHHTVDVCPSVCSPSLPNMTGTPDAYRPKGSLFSVSGALPSFRNRPYEPWHPE